MTQGRGQDASDVFRHYVATRMSLDEARAKYPTLENMPPPRGYRSAWARGNALRLRWFLAGDKECPPKPST